MIFVRFLSIIYIVIISIRTTICIAFAMFLYDLWHDAPFLLVYLVPLVYIKNGTVRCINLKIRKGVLSIANSRLLMVPFLLAIELYIKISLFYKFSN